MSDSPPIIRIDKTTLVPMGLLVAVVMSAISATVWINTALLKINHNVTNVTDKLDALNRRVDAINSAWWSHADMRAWVREAQAQNKGGTATFPDPQPTSR
jgi:cell division protein FtsL